MAEEQQTQPRQIAYKVSIGDLLKGEYIEQEGWQPNYVKIKEMQVSRVNIIASVIDVQVGNTLSTITIDDGGGTIQVRAFNEDSAKLADINLGDVVIIIGRPRKYGNQLFISYEIAKKLDPLWAKVRKNEVNIVSNFNTERDNGFEVKTETVKDSVMDKKKRILELIRQMDGGNGADMEEVMLNSGINPQDAESLVQGLIKAGEVYENIAGRVKLL